MRLLGFDVGEKRIGVAVSDELGITAQPITHLEVGGPRGKILEEVGALCREYGVTKAVVGLPLSMTGGDRGTSSRRARAFGAKLESELGLTVVFWDERFSTSEANRVLVQGNVNRRQRKGVVDKVAAAFILQGYLDAC